MKYIDVFNGDADGICGLQQLRLAEPLESILVTGVKRDISLLRKVECSAGDKLTVLDISLDKNRDALLRVLDAGCHVNYFDHHFAGDIPEHAGLQAMIDTSSETCTSLLVNKFLDSQYLTWAVVGTFGDNLYDAAWVAARPLHYTDSQLDMLCELGTLLNYNGYGTELSDLHFPPAELYLKVRPYVNPMDFIESEPAFQELKDGFESDMAAACEVPAELEEEQVALYVLPDTPWARRVSGVFGNQLARQHPNRAHALATRLDDGYRISVRAPIASREGADTLCRSFVTGGGRKAAAGINFLPTDELDRFVERFRSVFASDTDTRERIQDTRDR